MLGWNSSSIVCYTAISESYDKEIQGTALGFANALSVLISAVLQQLIGFIIDFIRHQIRHLYPCYTEDDYF